MVETSQATASLAVVADIHINLTHNKVFETNRIKLLAKTLIENNHTHIVIAGDLLDKARPSLEEIALAQEFIETLSGMFEVVYLLDGNHEAVNLKQGKSTYDYIKFNHCEYVKDSTIQISGVSIRLLSWSKLKAAGKYTKQDILISHIRADLPPFIKAERDMEFVKDYKMVILGDIHHKYSPFSNTHYTGSPYSISFSSSNPSGSYIDIVIKDGKYYHEYIDLDLPQKVKLELSPTEYKAYTFEDKHIYKVIIKGGLTDLRHIKGKSNVTLVKVIEEVEVDSEEVPDTEDLFDLLVGYTMKTMSKSKEKVEKTLLRFKQ